MVSKIKGCDFKVYEFFLETTRIITKEGRNCSVGTVKDLKQSVTNSKTFDLLGGREMTWVFTSSNCLVRTKLQLLELFLQHPLYKGSYY